MSPTQKRKHEEDYSEDTHISKKATQEQEPINNTDTQINNGISTNMSTGGSELQTSQKPTSPQISPVPIPPVPRVTKWLEYTGYDGPGFDHLLPIDLECYYDWKEDLRKAGARLLPDYSTQRPYEFHDLNGKKCSVEFRFKLLREPQGARIYFEVTGWLKNVEDESETPVSYLGGCSDTIGGPSNVINIEDQPCSIQVTEVAPDFTGYGIGRAMVEHFLDMLREEEAWRAIARVHGWRDDEELDDG